jgi:RHS repeat-associated protein
VLGLYLYKSRFYDPSLGRFSKPDTDVPESQEGRGLDRYVYVANNPVVFNDSTGHCWGVASAIRGVPSYNTTCNNLDMALEIVTSSEADTGQKTLAGGYIAAEAVAHAGLVVGVAGLVCSAVGSCAAAVEAALGIGTARAIDLSSKLGQNVWGMNPWDRGWAIENALGRSPGLAPNFPTIDRYRNGLVTSIKSIDLGAKTYQNLSMLTRTVKGYVNNLVNFNGASWGGFDISSAMIKGRQLILAIPTNGSTDQLKLLQELQKWAEMQGVDLILQTIK